MNIAIIGSGLTGSLAAISLANAGCRIDLYERLSDEELINRDTTYVITHSSRKILQKIGVWSCLLSKLVPFQYFNIIDYELNKKFQFNTKDLSISDQMFSALGWIAEHKNIMSSILGFISQIDNINKIPTSVIPNTNKYDLILVADGSNSNTKKKLKTPAIKFNYDQMCISIKVLLRGVNSHEGFVIQNSQGPFSVLPLGGDLFQIICSQTKKIGTYNMSLSKPLLLDYFSTILPYGIEPDTIIDEPKSFPINFLLSYLFFSGKYIYIGESAHNLHPVGGHGFNLCWRDVDCLTNLISIPLLKNNHSFIPLIYSLSRFFDVLSIALLTDSLVRYSRSNFNFVVILRKFVFSILKKSAITRKLILNLLTNGL